MSASDEAQYAEWAKTQKILEDRAAAASLAAPGVPPRGGPVLEPVDVRSPDAPSMYGGGAIGQPQAPPKKTLMQKAIDVGTELGGGSTNTEDVADPAVLARRKAGVSEAEQTNSEDVADPTKLAQRNESAGITPPGQEPVAEEEGTPAPSPGVFIPGGMRPNTEERDVHYAKGTAPGVREAYGAGMGLQLEAAKIERDAGAQYYDQQKHLAELKLNANQSAMQQQQRLTEDRDREVNKRLADIETLNTQARGKPEDIWSNPVIFGRLVGALLFGLGGAAMVANKGRNVGTGMGLMLSGQFVTGLINQDINAKLDERKQAGNQAKAQTDLLHLHLDRMDSEKKAVEATKLAYYDSVLQQMEIVNAESQGQINEAKYKNLQDQILEAKAKTSQGLYVDEQNDIHDKQINKYEKPKMLGSTGGVTKDIPNKVTLADGTTYALPNEKIHGKVLDHLIYLQQLQAKDKEILAERAKIEDVNPADPREREQWLTSVGNLKQLGQERMNITSVAQGQGVLNKSDRVAEDENGTSVTTGFTTVEGLAHSVPIAKTSIGITRKAASAVFRRDMERKDEEQKAILDSTGATLVQTGFNVDPVTHQKTPVARELGKSVKPPQQLAPEGFKPFDPSLKIPTAKTPVRDTTPDAPILDRSALPPPHASRQKKKKE